MSKTSGTFRLLFTSLAVLAIAGCTASSAGPAWPTTSMHYAPDGNFGASGQYTPRTAGFNLADVRSRAELDSLPAGVRGLVWLGDCGGATAGFRAAVDAFAGDPKLFGFYVADDAVPSTCPAAHLLAEDTWIHAHVPGARTFALVENLSHEISPSFAGSYTPANSGLDLVGIDPYPVRSELTEPAYDEIAMYVRAAEAQGWPQRSIVPVYQTFGGGGYHDDGNGHWVMPTAAQENQILARWAAIVPAPLFDYAYSWGPQNGDTALSQSAALQAVFAAKNAKSG